MDNNDEIEQYIKEQERWLKSTQPMMDAMGWTFLIGGLLVCVGGFIGVCVAIASAFG